MLPNYHVSCDFSFIEIYADNGYKTETCPERNPLLVLFYLNHEMANLIQSIYIYLLI